jgi:phenylalanyl-tRNA synthetase beta chain
MKIPLEWLADYVDLSKLSPTQIGDAFTQIGLMLDKPFDGKVFDLEHRFDRSDWLSILGCARDLAAYLNVELTLPKTYTQEGKNPASNQSVAIQVDCPAIVRRFNTRVFRNIKVKPSPQWLQSRLEDYGIPAINNIVDITNYVMVELGQPMHAQDLAKFTKQEIVIRQARDGEKLCTFLGDEISLYPESFVLTQDDVATVLGGIVGGRATGVDEHSTDIILDAGNYDQTVIRKVSRKLKIQNETVLRYDKFLHPDLTEYAIQRAAFLILELAGGEYYQNVDWQPAPAQPKTMTLRLSRIAKLAGFTVAHERVADILTRLGYQVLNSSPEGFKVVVPYFRTDVEVEDDIVSDVLRINGYANIPTAQLQSAPPEDITPALYTFEDTVRDIMVQLGAHEFITDPLVSRSEKLAGAQIVLENAQNSHKNALRTQLAGTLAELIPNYTKQQLGSGILFEVGKIYTQQAPATDWHSYAETRVVECLVFNTAALPKDLHKQTSALLTALLNSIGLKGVAYTTTPTAQEAAIMCQNTVLGTVRYNGFTLFTQELLNQHRQVERILTEVQNAQSIETSVVIAKNMAVGDMLSAIQATSPKLVKVDFLEEYTGQEIDSDKRSVLIKTYFTADISQSEAIKLVDAAIFKWKGISH